MFSEIVKMTSDGSSGEYSSDEEYSEDMTEDSEDFSDDTSDLSDDDELTEESIISSEESSKMWFIFDFRFRPRSGSCAFFLGLAKNYRSLKRI